MLLLATSPGGRGAATVLVSASDLFARMGAEVKGAFSLPSFHDNFGEEGIKDEELAQKLGQAIDALAGQ